MKIYGDPPGPDDFGWAYSNADTPSRHPDTTPPSWVRGTADDPLAEAAASQAAESSEAPRPTLDARTPEERRIGALEAEVKELRAEFGLVLELLHTMVNDMHSPKMRWDAKMLAVWKKHIATKKQQMLYNAE